MISCARIIEFDCGHRVIGHEGKCRNLHGHRYKLHANFESKELDSLGRVVDFSVIKEKLGGWIDENFDHTCILSTKDCELGSEITKITNQKIYYIDANPTAENIAKYLFEKIIPTLFPEELGLKCKKLTIFETPNCYAEITI